MTEIPCVITDYHERTNRKLLPDKKKYCVVSCLNYVFKVWTLGDNFWNTGTTDINKIEKELPLYLLVLKFMDINSKKPGDTKNLIGGIK